MPSTQYRPPDELKPYHEALERLTVRITKNRATARRWLLEHGFVTQEDIRQADAAARKRKAAAKKNLVEAGA